MDLNAASGKDLKVVAFFLATISIVALLATGNACAPPVDAVCGNGIVETGEKCDPPDGTTCDESCQAIAPELPVCGNGIVEEGEQCEPPNGITCDESCQTITPDLPVCGNGIVEEGEQCEPPNGTTCDESCQTITTPEPPVCGNGIVEEGEDCDPPDGTTCDQSCQGMEPPVPITTAGYDQLGRGYDVFTAYADSEWVKEKVLDLDALNNSANLEKYDVDKFSVSQFQGSTISEYANSMTVSAGLEGSYKFFSGAINATFATSGRVTTEYSFATVQIKHRVHGLRIVKMSAADLKAYLIKDAKDDINDPAISPTELLDMYGTHVIGRLVVGGRLDWHCASLITNEEKKRDIGVYAEAKFDNKFSSLQLNTTLDIADFESNYVSDTQFDLSSVGGQGKAVYTWTDGDYSQWVDTVWGNPVFCDFGADPWLIPIWELADGGCEAGSRCQEILAAYQVYAAGKEIMIPEATKLVITGIDVTVEETSKMLGYEVLKDINGSAENAYINNGASHAQTPVQYSDCAGCNSFMQATKVWIAYRAEQMNVSASHPINGIHLLRGGDYDDDMAFYGNDGHYDPEHQESLNSGTCGNTRRWGECPCGSFLCGLGMCAYYCDYIECTAPAPDLYLHITTTANQRITDKAIRYLVLGGPKARDLSLPLEDRKADLWWGPQECDPEDNGCDEEAKYVLDNVKWATDYANSQINVNEGAKRFYAYDRECPMGCCYVETMSEDAPEQYLGYVRW
jgi:hypothetical protein